MGFNDKQKEAIRKRAEELYGRPLEVDGKPAPDTGKYVLQATKQLFTPEDLEQIFVPAAPKPEVGPEEIKDVQQQLIKDEDAYILERTRQLEADQMSPAEARRAAESEIEEIRKAAPLGFGTPEERREGGLLVEGLEAILPGERKETPIAGVKSRQPSGIDYVKIGQLFEEQLGLDKDKAESDVEAFRINIVQPRRAALESQGIKGEELDRRAIEESFEVLKDLSERLTNKETYLQPETTGSGDPWIRAFSKQVELGEGVPDLTEEQRSYLNDTIQADIDRRAVARKGETKQVIKLSNGSEVSYDPNNPPPRLPAGASIVTVPKTPEEIRAEVEKEADVPWWATDKAEEIKKNPEKFVESGIFQSTTKYGTKKETTGAYLLRSALTIPNAVAGAASELTLRLGQLPEARERRRAEKGFAESPILLNIAENRGFFGEFEEATDILGIEGYARGAILAGAFAADLLDPSLDVVKGVTTAGRAATQNVQAINKLYGNVLKSGKASDALKNAAKIGFDDFADNAALMQAPGLRSLRFEPGDFRNFMTSQVRGDLKTQSLLFETGGDARAAYEALPQDLKQTTFGKTFKTELDRLPEGASVAQVSARMPQDSLAIRALEIERELDGVASGTRKTFTEARSKDVARSLGALAKVDEAVENILRDVFDGTVTSGTKLGRAIEKLSKESPVGYRKLKDIVLTDEAAKEVFEKTKDISGLGFENLVAVTRNTYTNRKTARELIERAENTDLGKLGSELDGKNIELIVTRRGEIPSRGGDIVSKSGPGTVLGPIMTEERLLPAYKLSDKQVETVDSILKQLVGYRKIDPITVVEMRKRLKSGNLLLEDYRKLLDANIDLIAEGLAATTGVGGVTRARDLSRLPIGEQMELLMPVEQRSLSRTGFRKLKELLTGRAPKEGNLTVGQRQLLGEARGKVANMDVTLREQIRRMQSDADFRAQFGFGPNDKPTINEIVSALLVGPKSGRVFPAAHINRQIVGVLNDLFYSKITQENIFDLLTGTSVASQKNIFTEAAMEELRPLLQEATRNIFGKPANFFIEIQPVITKAQEIIARKDPNLVRNVDDVVDIFAKNGGKIPPEVQLGAYYRSEGQRIAEEVVSDLINTEIGKNQLDLLGTLSEDVQKRVAANIQRAAGKPRDAAFGISGDISNGMILNRARRILRGEPAGVVTADDISEVLNIDMPLFQMPLFQTFLRDPAFLEDYQILNEMAEDVARGIIRSNGLKSADDPIREAGKLISELNNPRGDAYQQLDLLFGKDVADQLRNELTSGFNDNRDALITALSKGDVEKGAKKFFDVLQNLRYWLLLNSRIRFHGANLLTGADLVYSTTGKLPDIRSAAQAIEVFYNKNPNQVLNIAGRNFTVDELNTILRTQTGSTPYKAALPSAQQNRLIRMLTPGKVRSKLELPGNVLERFNELPQAEDTLYRFMTFKTALEQGRSLDEATALARRSMFDVSDIDQSLIPQVEKNLRKLSLFYGFQRNNLANAIRNFTSFKGWKRIGKASRTRDNLTDLLLGEDAEETREYSPSYAQTRVILDKIGFDPVKGKEIIITGPPLASLDAIYALADVLKGEVSGIVGGGLKQEYKSLLGVEDKFKIDPDKVPEDHIQVLKLFTDDPLDSINMLLTGFGAQPTTYVPATNYGEGVEIEGLKGGYVIPLTTPEQKKVYTLFMQAMTLSGITSPIRDYSRLFAPTGKVKVMGEQIRGRDFSTELGEKVTSVVGPTALLASAAGTPMTYMTPQQQAYYDLVARQKQLRGLTAALKKDENARLESEGETIDSIKSVTPAGLRKQVIEEAQKEAIRELPDLERELAEKQIFQVEFIKKLQRRQIPSLRDQETFEQNEVRIPELVKMIEAIEEAQKSSQ